MKMLRACSGAQGHAFEARVYAESPERGFMPGTGTLRRWAPPKAAVAFDHAGDVRVDSGVRAGDQVPDSCVAYFGHRNYPGCHALHAEDMPASC